jgi:thiamine pyrophosphokinase
MVTLILAAGDPPSRAWLDATWPGWADGLTLVITADGGAQHASGLDLTIDVWVGDGDSVEQDTLAGLEASGVTIVRASTAKDETDTELAIRWALDHGAEAVILLGMTGGPRLDHELANLALLAMPRLATVPTTIYTDRARIRLLREDGARWLALDGQVGDLVSLLPLGATVEGVRTTGLRYPLRDEPLPLGTPRGVSNVVVAPHAAVAIERGMLLVIETPATIAS